MHTVDLLVVGAGSGNGVANAVASEGQQVAIVEKGPIGGTCLNRGCIPSKMLLYHADVHETIEHSEAFHIDASVESVDFATMVREVNAEVAESAESIRQGLRSSENHQLFAGEGRFVDDRTVEMVTGEHEGTRIEAESVLIAAGTRPTIPPIDGIEDVAYLTSREALELETLPEHLVIVGGGYIAAELSHFFGTFGSEVTIVGRRPRLLPQADEEVAAAFTERYADRFTLHTGHTASAVSEAGGEITVEAQPYEYGNGEDGGASGGVVSDADGVQVTGDELLIAAGRRPNTDTLNLEATEVSTDEEGFVETDEYLRAAEDVWALGDVVGEYLLKHSANHEAQTVARNVLGDDLEPVDYSAMPFAVFASPEVAGVGATESELRAEGRDYATNTYRYENTGRGDAMHAEGFVKAVVTDGSILGCHVVGPDASTLIQEAVVAMQSGSGSVENVRQSIHVHPALPEVVQRAFAGPFDRAGTNGGNDAH
jgi:dihydrolipoamide dehydrogenase